MDYKKIARVFVTKTNMTTAIDGKKFHEFWNGDEEDAKENP